MDLMIQQSKELNIKIKKHTQNAYIYMKDSKKQRNKSQKTKPNQKTWQANMP